MSSLQSMRGPGVDALVERQMRNWEHARAHRAKTPIAKRTEVEDFVTISREVGSGGAAVARAVASRLGWPMFDKELLDTMAGDDALRRHIYASMDERDLSWWEETLRTFLHPQFGPNDYFRRLTETVLSIARQGHAVFLGRACDLVLPATVGFRVRLVASMDYRSRALAERQNIPVEEAKREIIRLEGARGEFVRRHFHRKADAPDRFDLTIRMERFAVERAAELILAARKMLALEG